MLLGGANEVVYIDAHGLPAAPGPARLTGMSNPTDAPQQWKLHTATAT